MIQNASLPGLIILTAQHPDEVQISTDCELVFGEPSLVSQVIGKLPNLRWVQSTWAGVEPLLVEGLRRDYTLTKVRGVYGPLIAEYVFAYLLAIERRVIPRWQAQQETRWDNQPHGTLHGKLLGLLGVGSIGAQLARTARCFGMRLRGYTRQSEDCHEVEHYFHAGQKLAFAHGLDYLVCTLPGTTHTRGFVDAEMLKALPAHTWLVNAGRGNTVDEPALVNALNNRQIAGAVLDVFQEEPLPPDHPLWHTPDTFITAHTAALNHPPDIAGLFMENYRRYLIGKTLIGLVDFAQEY